MKIKTRKLNCHGNLSYTYNKPIPVESPDDPLPPATINHFIDIVNNKLKYKMMINNDQLLLNLSLDLNLIKQSSNLNVDQTLIGISDKVIYTCLGLDNMDTPYEIAKYELINMYVATFLNKDGVDSAIYNGNKCPFKIFVPSKNSNFTDYTLVLYGDWENEPTVSHTYSSETLTLEISELTRLQHVVSEINVTASKSSLNVDDSVTLTLTTADTTVTEVYAEAVFGIIPKTRIPLINGVGTVIVSSLGLSSGDPIRIKFGYKNFTGVSEYTNTIA